MEKMCASEVEDEALMKDMTAERSEVNIVTCVEKIIAPFSDQSKMDLLGYVSVLPSSEISIDSMISRAIKMTSKVIHPINSVYQLFLLEVARDDLFSFITAKKRLPETTFSAPATSEIQEKFQSHVERLIEQEESFKLRLDEIPLGTLWHILSKSVNDIPEEAVGMRGSEIAAALKNGRYIAESDGVQYLYVDAITRLADLTCVNDLAGKFEAAKANDVGFSIYDYVTSSMKDIKAGSGKRMTGSLTRVSRKIQSTQESNRHDQVGWQPTVTQGRSPVRINRLYEKISRLLQTDIHILLLSHDLKTWSESESRFHVRSWERQFMSYFKFQIT